MSKLSETRLERSLLLQRLQELKSEIKHEEIIDLKEKWDKLQDMEPCDIKIAGLGEQKTWYGGTSSPKVSLDIFEGKDKEVFIQYQKDSRILAEQIDKIRCYYRSNQHTSIVKTIIDKANNTNNISLKRQLINNLSEHRKKFM